MRVWRSVGAPVALACVVAVVLFVGFTALQKPHQAAKRQVVSRNVVPSQSASATVDSRYVGYWCDSKNADRTVMSIKGMDSMEIKSIDRGLVVFDVLHTGASPSYR